jgi:hypothetical protein
MKTNLKKIIFLFAIAIMIGGVSHAQNFKYIGAVKCKMCHNKPNKGSQYDKWMEGPHANAMKSLKGDEAKDPSCLSCHATTGHVDAKLVATLKESEGVSCESCHGPGSAYKNAAVMKSREKSMERGLILPEEKVCKECHNEKSPHYKGFNYKEYVARISHDDPTTE